MKKGLLLFIFLAITFPGVLAANFTLCKSQYALCTTAKCVPIPGKKGWVSCNCDVKTGYSVGKKACEKPQTTTMGQQIRSRYYPIKGYIRCSNNRPWAWCLDSPCLIDKSDPTKAACKCSIVKNKGDYIIVASAYSASACSSGLYSSALVTQANQITDFLKTQSELKPFPIKVYQTH